MKQTKPQRGLRYAFVSVGLLLTLAGAAVVGLITPTSVQAQSGFSVQLVPPSCTDEDGCNVCEVVKVFTNFADLIGVFLSSLALLMFIVGGFMWIFSGGEAERIEKGKKIILGTVTGLAIVFLAWFAVNVIVRVASSSGTNTENGLGTSTQIFSRGWWDLSYCQPPIPRGCLGYPIGTICGWGDIGCAASGDCTCWRPQEEEGDNGKCTGLDVSSVEAANYQEEQCYCASQCTRLAQQPGKEGYHCVANTVYTANANRYQAATGVTCPSPSDVCVKETARTNP